jgi:hypothetical protein
LIVYIAGPMSKGFWETNMRDALDIAAELVKAGHAPIVPNLYTLLSLTHPECADYEAWMKMDFQFVLGADAVFRRQGESPGADREVAFAKENGIAVFTFMAPMLDYLSELGHARAFVRND